MSERFTSHPIPDTWKTRGAFEIQGRTYSFLDVIHASEIRGSLDPVLATSRQARACEVLAEMGRREPDMDAVGVLLDEFRYSRGLVTVEETERWLEENGMTVEDLSDHFLRRHWQLELGREADLCPETDSAPPAFWPFDILISGDFLRLARHLAREATCAHQHPAPSDSLTRDLLESFRSRRRFDAAAYGEWRSAWGLTDAAVASFLFAQWCHDADRKEALNSERRAAALSEQRTSLVRVELVVVQFDTEAAAHEAYLCVTADGMTLEEVATDAGYPLRQVSAFVREFPEEWHLPLLSAIPGRTLHPLPDSGTHQVCRVITHSEPELTDPAVAAELDSLLLERHFGHLESREVRWLIPTEAAA